MQIWSAVWALKSYKHTNFRILIPTKVRFCCTSFNIICLVSMCGTNLAIELKIDQPIKLKIGTLMYLRWQWNAIAQSSWFDDENRR